MLFLVSLAIFIVVFAHYTAKKGLSEGIFHTLGVLIGFALASLLAFFIQAGVNPVHTTDSPVSDVVFYSSTNTYQVDTGTASITVDPDRAIPGNETVLRLNEREDMLIVPWDIPPVFDWYTLTYNPEELDIRP